MFIHFEGKNGRKVRGEVIKDELSLKRLVKQMRTLEEFAYDTETTGLEMQAVGKQSLVGISISWGGTHNYYIPVGHVFDDDQLDIKVVIKNLKPIFEREDVRIIGWNLN